MWSWYTWLLIRTSECIAHQGHPQGLLLLSHVLHLQSFSHQQFHSQSLSHVHHWPKFYGYHWYFHPESPVLFVLQFPGFLHSCSCCSYKPTCHMHKHWNNINQYLSSNQNCVWQEPCWKTRKHRWKCLRRIKYALGGVIGLTTSGRVEWRNVKRPSITRRHKRLFSRKRLGVDAKDDVFDK